MEVREDFVLLIRRADNAQSFCRAVHDYPPVKPPERKRLARRAFVPAGKLASARTVSRSNCRSVRVRPRVARRAPLANSHWGTNPRGRTPEREHKLRPRDPAAKPVAPEPSF